MRTRYILVAACLCVLTARPHSGRAAGEGSALAQRVLRQLAATPGDRDVLEMLRASLGKVEDGNDLGDLMVIYCLGCYYTGQGAKAESLKPIIVRKCPSNPNLKYLTTRFTRERCTDCGTSGQRKSACGDCGGGGRCSRCNGRGYRMMAGIGKQNKVNCAKCRSRGKCATCSGQGSAMKACGSCGGSGQKTARTKVKTVYIALLKGERIDDAMFAGTQPPRGRTDTPAGRADVSPAIDDRPTSGDTQRQMDAYIDTMGALDKMFAERKVQETSLTELMALPDRHKGKLLRSRGYILSCYPREVVVAPRSSAPRSDGTSLIPRSLEVGMKAVGLYEKVGKGKRVVVTYGIVSKDNRTLYDIEAL